MESYFLPCQFKAAFGFPCPGCGMQRAFQYLVEGDIRASIMMYPALLPILATIAYSLFFFIKKGKKARYIIFLILFDVSLVVINYVFTLIHFFK